MDVQLANLQQLRCYHVNTEQTLSSDFWTFKPLSIIILILLLHTTIKTTDPSIPNGP